MGVEAGTLIAGRFRVLSELGRGGMAVVYLAEDQHHPGPPIALKIVPGPGGEDDLGLRRFRREASMLAQLRHPNLLEILDTGPTESGGLWLSMPRLQGEGLDARLNRGPLPLEDSLRVAREVAEALQHAHERGIVHRDLKPSNVFLDAAFTPPRARVLDFGISRVFNDPALTRLTATGRTLGSPGYMSPEQIHGADVDGRSDIYALGILLFQMLAGRPPLPISGEMLGVLRAHLEQAPERLSVMAPWLRAPDGLEALISSMLEKRAASRPEDMARVRAELLRLGGAVSTDVAPSAKPASDRPPRIERKPRRPSWVALGLTAGLGAASVLIFVASKSTPVELSPPPTPVAASESAPRVIAEPEPAPIVEVTPAVVVAPERPAPKKRERRLAPRTAAPESAEVTPAARALAAPLPNDAALRENIRALGETPNTDERISARAELVRLFRKTIESLPAAARGPLSRDLAGLAAAGSADGFRGLHDRARSAWSASP